jgi:cobalt-zinc-cadmium efflux system outer membrane protein
VKSSYILVFSTLLAATICPGAGAQQSPEIAPQRQAQKLTLSRALDLAEKQNLDLAAARAQVAVAQAGVRIAGERPNPTVNFSATRDTPHESLFFDQPIELGSRRNKRIELAKQQGVLTDVNIVAVERRVRLEVRNTYYGLAFARGSTVARANAWKLASRLHDIASERLQAGDIPQLEVTQAELEEARARAEAQIAQQEEKVALSELNAVLNEPATLDWDLGDAFRAMPPSLALDDLLLRSGVSNAEISQISQEQKVQERQTALLEAERIPNLVLQFGADFNAKPDFQTGARGQLSMELPIFAHYQGEIAQSKAAQRALEGELAAARRSVDAKVESALFDLEARRSQVELYRHTLLPASRRLNDLAEDSYRAGKANILTVLGAQRDVQQMERDYLDSLLAMQSAFARLEEAVGVRLN